MPFAVSPSAGADASECTDRAYRAKYADPGSGAAASVYDNPEDEVYRLEPERVITWTYGTMGHWTEWRFDPVSPPDER